MADEKPEIPDTPPRQNKLTADRREDLLKFLRGGLPIETVSRLIGVSPAVVTHWRKLALDGHVGYEDLEDEIQKALAEGEAIHVARIAEAGRVSWRASAWLLERMYPERWGEPMRIPDAPPAPVNDFAGL